MQTENFPRLTPDDLRAFCVAYAKAHGLDAPLTTRSAPDIVGVTRGTWTRWLKGYPPPRYLAFALTALIDGAKPFRAPAGGKQRERR